jgi:hypothetical protein
LSLLFPVSAIAFGDDDYPTAAAAAEH